MSRTIYAVEQMAADRARKAKAEAMQQLVRDLARWHEAIESQREMLDEEKKQLKSLEETRDAIVGELARRGHGPPATADPLPFREHLKGARDD
jgi:hypothetical protein